MGTIYVHGVQSSRRTGALLPYTGVGGVYNFIYNMQGRECIPINEHLDPYHVAEVIDRMQDTLPLGAIGDYHVFCLDVQFSQVVDGRWLWEFVINGERFNGFQVLSGKLTRPAWDIVTHEMGHEVDKSLFTEADRNEIHAILGIPRLPDVKETPWQERSQEVIPEYLTLVLQHQPLHEWMWERWGYPSWDQRQALKAWAERKFAGRPRATVQVVPDMLEVSVTDGSNLATVNGKREQLVPGYSEATAITHGGFFSLPMASITRWLGGTKSWDETTRTGTFRLPQR